MYITRQKLKEENDYLRNRIRELEKDIQYMEKTKAYADNSYHMIMRHMSVMSIANERVADAMAHIVTHTLQAKKGGQL